MKRWIKYTSFLFIVTILFALQTLDVNAQTIVPASGDQSGKTDYKNIMGALDNDGDVVLEDGATYYLKATLWLENNSSITATGATIISKSGAFRNRPSKGNYQSVKNVSVEGGTWKYIDKDGFKKSFIQFSHGQNITLKNLTVYSNYQGHGIELVACKNVLVDNCVLKGVGKTKKNSVEEQLQIDIATPRTAPTVGQYSKKLVKGQTCQNITVQNCVITGSRGICANYASKEKQFKKYFHKNIVLKNNTITGMTGEAVALFNVIGATIEDNTIVTKSSRTSSAYSVGLHIAMFGKAPSSMKKAVYTVRNNMIKGGRQGFYVFSHSSSKFGKVVAEKNMCYAKKGKKNAIKVTPYCVKKKKLSKNKSYKW